MKKAIFMLTVLATFSGGTLAETCNASIWWASHSYGSEACGMWWLGNPTRRSSDTITWHNCKGETSSGGTTWSACS